jgi:hypothetical protein
VPIDPQIPLGVQAPQQNPMASIAFGQELAQRQQDNQALAEQRQAQTAKLQEQQAHQQRVMQIVQSAVDPQTGTLNTDEAMKGLRASGFTAEADAIQKNADASFESHAKGIGEDLKNRAAEVDLLMKKGRAVQTVGATDPAAWQSFVTDVAKSPVFGPQVASGMPTRFDPDFMEKALAWGDDQKQTIDRAQNIATALKDKPKTMQDWMTTAGNALGATKPDEYQHVLGVLEFRGMPKEVADLFKGKSPEQAGQMGLTQEQRQQAAQSASGQALTAAGQAETAAYHKAELAQGAQRLAQSAAGVGGADDVKLSVAGMKDGSLPPQLPGRASKDYTAIMAEAKRQGFDLAKANEDWVATQKHLATMNGQQQERLRQAISFTKESLPLVRQLITQWDSAGYPVLSKAALDAAAAGAGTKEQQSLAVRLKGQIADLTSELGTVYKGGNSSTDESLKLAGENLSGSWSKQAALDAIDQIDKNIGFRENSMRNSRAVTSGGDNPYDRSADSAKSGTAYGGEVRTSGDGRMLGKIGNTVVELTKSGAGWVVK